MSVPRPPIELQGHCSTIVNDTLYVLSPGGFQSLPLKEKAKWSKEPDGVKVTGPACVTVKPNGDDNLASLWVIGGTTQDNEYDGLQVYSFAQKTWQTLTTAVPVMKGRVNHSAAFLQDSESILVYAGSQQIPPNALSSETFAIDIRPPFAIRAFTSDAPPANIPILQPWDSSSAVMVGGSTLNTKVSIFSPDFGWRQLGTDLVTPLDPTARGTLIDGADGSKVLEVYDANVSPNTVTQIVLLGAQGGTAQTGEIIGNDSARNPPTLRRRALTLDNWPPYSEKDAPTAQRSDFSVVQNPSGVAVISGGNNNSPVALFNQQSNAWIDAGKFFKSDNQQPLRPTSTKVTLAPSSTASSSPTASSTGESQHDRELKVLGIILGVLFGIGLLFAVILFLLRVQKRKKRAREGWIEEKSHPSQQQTSGADRGASFLKETGGTTTAALQPPPNTPWRQSRNSAHNSMAIIAGKFNKRASNRGPTNRHGPQSSGDSTAQLVRNRQGDFDSRGAVELADIEKRPGLERRMTPRQERSDRAPSAIYGQNLTEQDANAGDESGAARINRNRSSGWSKYFATSAPTGSNGLGHIPSAYVKKTEGAAAAAAAVAAQPSDRNHQSQHSRIASSTVVPESGKTLDGQPVSHVLMRSPAFNDSNEDFAKRGSTATEGQKGLIVDPNRRSDSDSISSYNRSATSSARNSDYQEQTNWTPTAAGGGGGSFKDHLNNRPPSTSTGNDPDKRVPSRGKSSHFFPGAGTTYRPPPKSPKTEVGRAPALSTQWQLPKSMGMGMGMGAGIRPADPRDSNMTVWPSHKSNTSADYSKPVERQLQQQQQQRFMMGAAGGSSAALPGPSPAFRGAAAGADNRGSNMTVFPGVPSAYYAADHRAQRSQDSMAAAPARPLQSQSDMGWVNLGLHGNGSQTRL